MPKLLAIDVACPHCRAEPEQTCVTTGGYAARCHLPRWRAAGIQRPTLSQMIRNGNRAEWFRRQQNLAAIQRAREIASSLP